MTPCRCQLEAQAAGILYSAAALRKQAELWRTELTSQKGLAALRAAFIADFAEQRCKDLEQLAAGLEIQAKQVLVKAQQLPPPPAWWQFWRRSCRCGSGVTRATTG